MKRFRGGEGREEKKEKGSNNTMPISASPPPHHAMATKTQCQATSSHPHPLDEPTILTPASQPHTQHLYTNLLCAFLAAKCRGVVLSLGPDARKFSNLLSARSRRTHATYPLSVASLRRGRPSSGSKEGRHRVRVEGSLVLTAASAWEREDWEVWSRADKQTSKQTNIHTSKHKQTVAIFVANF